MGMTRLRDWGLALALAGSCLWSGGVAAQAIEVDGVRLSNTTVVNEQRLQLNGAGVSKRGYYKVYVASLYLPEKKASLEAIAQLPGPKRLQLNVLRELSGATISRYFINDFRAAATDAEFRMLINEMTSVGAVYGTLVKVSEGDVFWIDFVPGKGIIVQRNGTAIIQADFKPYHNTPGTELMFQILLRMYAGKDQPEELQKNLMGLSSSMQTIIAAAEPPPRPARKDAATTPSAPPAAAPAVTATEPAEPPANASPAATAVAVPTVPPTLAAPEPARRSSGLGIAASAPASAASSVPRQARVWTGTRWARPSELGASSPQRAKPKIAPVPPAASAPQ
jgi:hypothetical protein